MMEVSKFTCEIKDLLMISARFLRDSANDKPAIDGGELDIVQALEIELIPKQNGPAARKGTYCGFRIFVVRVITDVLGCFDHLPQCTRTAR
jgi:hypothetical protein